MKWIIGSLVAVLLAATLGYVVAPNASSDSDMKGDHSEQGARKVLYWHDPMVPGKKFDKPGKSPFMDMQLVPMYADDGGGTGTGGTGTGGTDVRINATVAQNLGIRLGTVEKKSLSREFSAVGSVSFDERLLEVVQARVNGNVTHLHVKAPFERVRRGQPLAELLAPEWLAAQQEYLALLDASSESTRAIRDAARQRLVVLGVPDASIRALEADRKTHPTTTLYAPIDGVVKELSMRQGGSFMAGDSLLQLNGLATVWVNAQIPEAQVARVSMGSSVTARATAWPQIEFKGRVIALLPEIDLQTRTLAVRIEIDNAQRKLSPGMFVSLSFTNATVEPQLVVPSEAVIVTGERSVVIVSRGQNNGQEGFDVVDVKLGAESGGMSVILAGLEEGQSIVLSGQFLIDSEASLRSTVERLTTSPAIKVNSEPLDSSAQPVRP